MDFPDELRNKIEKLLKKSPKLKAGILRGDAEAIRYIGIESQKGIDPLEIISAYESDKINRLYLKAKKIIELQELYKELYEFFYLSVQEKGK